MRTTMKLSTNSSFKGRFSGGNAKRFTPCP